MNGPTGGQENADYDWLPFEFVNQSGVTMIGVYVIWYAGQGDIVKCVGARKTDPAILAFRTRRKLSSYGQRSRSRLTGTELRGFLRTITRR